MLVKSYKLRLYVETYRLKLCICWTHRLKSVPLGKMKAGSLLDDNAVALRESPASSSSVEACLEVCSRLLLCCLHLFFNTMKLILQQWNFVLCTWIESKFACVAKQQKHLSVKQASNDFVGASPTACTRAIANWKRFQGCRLTGKPPVSKIEILGSNPSIPATLIESQIKKWELWSLYFALCFSHRWLNRKLQSSKNEVQRTSFLGRVA